VQLPATNNTTGKFKDTFDLVESFCLQYSMSNENLIVLGDFNAHLSDSRSGQPENTRGKLLRMMFNKFNMTSINTQDYCSESKYIYMLFTGCEARTEKIFCRGLKNGPRPKAELS
jgi:hypothetical protein